MLAPAVHSHGSRKGYTIADTPGDTEFHSWTSDLGLYPLYVLCCLLVCLAVLFHLGAFVVEVGVVYVILRGKDRHSR